VRATGGPASAPTATPNGQGLGGVFFSGYSPAGYAGGVRIWGYASELWSDTAHGSVFAVDTTLNGTVAPAERMRIDHNGNVGIGTTGPSGKLHVVNNDSNLILDTPTANQTASISFRDGGNARWGLFTSASASHDFGLYNSTTASVSLTVQSSSGNVGIGTTTPQFLLDVAGSAKSYNLTVGDLTAHDGYIGLYARSATAYAPGIDMSVTSAYAGFQISRDTSLTNFWAVKTINTGQNIGIFTDNNPANGIFVATGGRVAIGTTSLVTGVKLYASNTTAGWWAARFSSVSGAHGVIITAGATSTEYPLLIQDTTGVTNLCIIYGNGACYNISGSWGSLSDRQVKQDITLYERGLDAIVKLSPVYFRYAPNTPMGSGEKPSRRLFGLIADEVKPHIPEVVGTMVATVGKKEGVELSTLEPGNLIYALINAVKELNAKVEAMTPPPARRKAA
jgi:hypothetical protein